MNIVNVVFNRPLRWLVRRYHRLLKVVGHLLLGSHLKLFNHLEFLLFNIILVIFSFKNHNGNFQQNYSEPSASMIVIIS